MSNGRAVQYVISHGGNCEFPQRARLVDPKFSDGNLPLVVCIPVDPFGSSRPKFCESTAAVSECKHLQSIDRPDWEERTCARLSPTSFLCYGHS
jgi:hypothetical protein